MVRGVESRSAPRVTKSIRRKTHGVLYHTEGIPEAFETYFGATSSPHRTRTSIGSAKREETLEATITDAYAIAIDSTSTDDERTEAINDFVEDIRSMSGERIVAIAVVSD